MTSDFGFADKIHWKLKSVWSWRPWRLCQNSHDVTGVAVNAYKRISQVFMCIFSHSLWKKSNICMQNINMFPWCHVCICKTICKCVQNVNLTLFHQGLLKSKSEIASCLLLEIKQTHKYYFLRLIYPHIDSTTSSPWLLLLLIVSQKENVCDCIADRIVHRLSVPFWK